MKATKKITSKIYRFFVNEQYEGSISLTTNILKNINAHKQELHKQFPNSFIRMEGPF